MVATDVNVLIYAHRIDAVDHLRYRDWLSELINSDSVYGISELVLSSFLRIVTHPRIFSDPTPLDKALAFTSDLRDQPNCVLIGPQERHWEIFTRLCKATNARGHMIPDAYLAALAIESGMEWITTDRGFARFPGLRWRHPVDPLR